MHVHDKCMTPNDCIRTIEEPDGIRHNINLQDLVVKSQQESMSCLHNLVQSNCYTDEAGVNHVGLPAGSPDHLTYPLL